MLRAHTFRACLKSLRAHYAHAYERAHNFLRSVVTKKCHKNPIPVV